MSAQAASVDRIADLEAEIIWLKERLESRFDGADRLCEGLRLTPNQGRLLMLLHTARGRAVSQAFIDENLPLGKGHERESAQAINVLICLLRKRVGPRMIGTKWGFGYFITPAGRALVDEALAAS
jgi:DNA-binding response OmpR family regulator